MKPNWRAVYISGHNWIGLDFYIKPRKGQEGKGKERDKAFDFASNITVRHMFKLQNDETIELTEVGYLGD